MQNECELTILMPCLNEAETLAGCIEKARTGLERVGLRGEVSARRHREGKGLRQRLARRH